MYDQFKPSYVKRKLTIAKYLYHSIKFRDNFVKMDSESVWEE